MKFFHGFPLGSFKKNLTLSISSLLSLAAAFLELCHTAKELIRREEVHHAKIRSFIADGIQKDYGRYPLYLVLLEQSLVKGIAALGHIHFDHDKITLRLFYDRGIVKGDSIEFPAGSAPRCIKIDDYWLFMVLSLL
jgi:hypothetical protein